MTEGEVGLLVDFLGAAYPASKPDRGTVAAWALVLAPFDAAAIREAAHRHVLGSRFLPTVAELVAGAAERALALPDPEVVVGEILAAVHASSVPPSDLSPLAAAVLDVVGWRRVEESVEPGVLRAELRRVAERLRSRAVEAGSLAAAGLAPPTPCPPLERRLGSPRSAGSLLGDALRSLGCAPALAALPALDGPEVL